MHQSTPVSKVLSKLEGIRKQGNGWSALCPAHEDTIPSLSISEGADGRVLLKCFAGCSIESVLAAIGLTMRDLFEDRGQKKGSSEEISVATLAADKGLPPEFLRKFAKKIPGKPVLKIIYKLEDGTLAPRQRLRTTLSAGEGSRWTKGQGKPVPYGLWRREEAQEAGYLVLVEGESDSWTLWFHEIPGLGIPGANMTRALHAEHVRDIEKVFIIREPDEGGEAFVAGLLERFSSWKSWRGKLFEVPLHQLTGCKDVNVLHKKDVHGFKAAFQNALENATPIQIERGENNAGGAKDAEGLPHIRICAQNLNLREVAAQAWEAIQASNDPPKIFHHATGLVRIEQDGEGFLYARTLCENYLRHILARFAYWYKHDGEEIEPALPPMHVVRDLLVEPEPPIPYLSRIVTHPIYSEIKKLQIVSGYDKFTRCFLDPTIVHPIPEILENPRQEDLRRARERVDDLLGDFPFCGPAEKAHAIALKILPFVRLLIPGSTPVHSFESPFSGSGKTLCARAVTYPALGHVIASMSEGRDDEEWRKRITAALIKSPAYLLLDNIRRRLDSSSLASAITSTIWQDRLLGKSKIVRLPVRCGWIVTANNPSFSSEIARRTIRIRIDAKVDRPWMRDATSFRHPNLMEWVEENRHELIWAALTMVQAWIAEGCPDPEGVPPLGMFEQWRKVIGGILMVSGIPGFLGNLNDFYENSDAEGAALRSFVNSWWEAFSRDEVGVTELYSLIIENELPINMGKSQNVHSQKTWLGNFLRKLKDVHVERFRIIAGGTRKRAQLWRLEPVDDGERIACSPGPEDMEEGYL